MIDPAEVEAVLEDVSVPEALEFLGLESPSRIPGKVLCPWHPDQKPSLWIQESRYWCFACGKGGDVIDLVRHVTGAGFGHAVALLGGASSGVRLDRPVVERVEPKLLDLTAQFKAEALPYWNEDAVRFIYTKWPHLSLDLLWAWGVRCSTYNLLIPHRDDDGIIRGVKTRSLLPHQDGKRSAFEGSNFTSRLYRVREDTSADICILTEGESDAWTLSAHYMVNRNVQVYALPAGASTWREAWATDLLRHKRIFMALDHDEAGRRAARSICDTSLDSVSVLSLHFPSEFKDVTEAYIGGWVPLL